MHTQSKGDGKGKGEGKDGEAKAEGEEGEDKDDDEAFSCAILASQTPPFQGLIIYDIYIYMAVSHL